MCVCSVVWQAAGDEKTDGDVCVCSCLASCRLPKDQRVCLYVVWQMQVIKRPTVVSGCAVVWQAAGDGKTDGDICVCSCLTSCR